MIVQVDNYTTENDSKNEKQYIAANKYLVLAAILMIINSVLGSFFALKDGIYYMKYQLTSTNNYSDMAYGIAFICFGIFCLFILFITLYVVIRCTYNYTVYKPFKENKTQDNDEQHRCHSLFNWGVKLIHIYKRVLSFLHHRYQYEQSDDELSLYRRESPDHLSFIFRHNIIYYIVDDSGRWTLQVQVPDPFSSLFVVMNYSCYFNTYGTEYR
ncbi:unnamed protein product [Rotaria socialis]|uniref:Transmembrane protein n=1 Tax=Rotaria socialis TaxID=392032 RepID=A0A817M8R2_9BILA|nr:unnamed protein product [Rotaria socialis]